MSTVGNQSLTKTLEAYNAYPEIDLIAIQHPALPTGWNSTGRIFPPNPGWIEDVGLPPQMGQPTKEVIYVRNDSGDSIAKAEATWRKVASRIGPQRSP